MKKIGLIFLLVIVVIAGFLAIRFFLGGPEDAWLCVDGEWVKHGNPSAPMPDSGCGQDITSFEECAAAGNPIMESYPRQCRANNKTFAEYIGNELEKTDLIQIENPRPNQLIESPLTITGTARGNWFFEATFPVVLQDANGNVLAQHYATAQGEWMTVDFVPFSIELTFTKPQTKTGLLLLQKDNPSGLPENDDQLEVPVVFE